MTDRATRVEKASPEPRTFQTPEALEKWLKVNHERETELWVRIYKKDSGVVSVTWNDSVLAGLTWGWIDGLRKSLDDVSFLQRLTPRRAKSSWSMKNREHAERLIAEGLMQPAGLKHVETAKHDGRWDTAYAGSATMEIPDDFLSALSQTPAALDFYGTLNRANLFAIYHRLHTAKTPTTRAARIDRIIAQLAQGKPFH